MRFVPRRATVAVVAVVVLSTLLAAVGATEAGASSEPAAPDRCWAEVGEYNGNRVIWVHWSQVDGAYAHAIKLDGVWLTRTSQNPAGEVVLSFPHQGAPESRTLQYSVRAITAEGKSSYTDCAPLDLDERNEGPLPPAACEAVVSVAADGSRSAKVTWSEVDGAWVYAIKRDGVWLDRATAAAYSDAEIPASSDTRYAVRAVTAAGKTAYVDCTIAPDDPPVDPAPDGPIECIAARSADGTVRLAWQGGRGTYAIERNGAWLTRVEATGGNWLDESAPAGTVEYGVRSIAENGQRSDYTTCYPATPEFPEVVPATFGCPIDYPGFGGGFPYVDYVLGGQFSFYEIRYDGELLAFDLFWHNPENPFGQPLLGGPRNGTVQVEVRGWGDGVVSPWVDCGSAFFEEEPPPASCTVSPLAGGGVSVEWEPAEFRIAPFEASPSYYQVRENGKWRTRVNAETFAWVDYSPTDTYSVEAVYIYDGDLVEYKSLQRECTIG